MRNPFEYGSVVGTRAFCNREGEQRILRRTIENAGRLFLYSQRRTGKPPWSSASWRSSQRKSTWPRTSISGRPKAPPPSPRRRPARSPSSKREKDWRPFIQGRFDGAGKTIPSERVAAVCDLTGGYPFYVQHLCHVLWERCEKGSAVVEEDVEEVVDILLGLTGEAPGAAEALLGRDLIDRENGLHVVLDRFFRLWIRQL